MTEIIDDAMSPSCLHTMVEEQARLTPDSHAVVSVDGTLTYRMLDESADELAHELRQQGVAPEVLVGICMDKTPEMIIGILAVLKAGGAYVPLDPRSPAARMAEAPLHLVLTADVPASHLGSFGCPLLSVDSGAAHTAATPSAQVVRPAGTVQPDNLAYVIFTSGSTGQPKGVAVEHRSVVYSTLARTALYPSSRAFLLLSAMTSDSAVAGIFGTLTRGGALHLPAPGTEADVVEIGRLIKEHAIDATVTLPSLYDLLLDTAEPNSLRSLRTVTVAGERCPTALPVKSRAKLPAVELYNEYGPTEASVWCTVWRASEEDIANLATVPIGRPTPGTSISILDGAGRLVPRGEQGELAVSGPGVARGYHGRPDLTDRVFDADPYGPPGVRRYRTGDLARFRADGQLEFLGRIDRQVKIRGHRVEPDEVEAAMANHSGVRQVAVIADEQGVQVRLAAFFTGDPIAPSRLQEHLRGTLPAHMVPSRISRIDAFPATANGKIDRNALVTLLGRERHAAPVSTPATAAEDAVAEVWSDVLGAHARADRSASFFELGSSLDSIRIAVGLSQVFGEQMPVVWVQEDETIKGLGKWIVDNIADAEARAAVWIDARRSGSDHGE
jgi:amino acid adenylation domain-containing protein